MLNLLNIELFLFSQLKKWGNLSFKFEEMGKIILIKFFNREIFVFN